MSVEHIILLLLWIVYCVLHSVLAAGKVKRWAERWMGARYRYYRIGYTIFSFVGLVGILLYQVSITSPLLYKGSIAIQVAGCALAALGAALVMLNIIKYFVRLSGVRWLTSEKMDVKLERDGLHKYVRHPLYFSTFLFIWSLWIVYPYLSLLVANVVITSYTVVALQFEEAKLVKEFGQEYETYRKEVPRLLPKIRF
ncbi:MAG TPA: methyltransferase [Chitinophagaceae bacterium]|nr:methyltransferase [Chitinophagaceae bacterium]